MMDGLVSEKALMDPWDILNNELDAWAASGKVADLWWRDDDAVAAVFHYVR